MSTRRQFLKQASLATTGLVIGKSDWFKKKKEVGLQLYTLRDEVKKDLKATIARVAQIGYNNVETFGYSAGKYFGLSTAEFAAIFAQNHLKTPSGHYSLPDYLSKGDMDDLKKTVEDSRALSHHYFTVPYLPENLRTGLDSYKELADKLNKAGEVAKDAGMKLAYHNHNFEFNDWGGGQTGYATLLKQTDPQLVHFEMDIFWVSKAGVDPIALIKANPGRFPMWHVKDMDNSPEKTFTEVGTGVINYKEIFNFKETSGMKYFFVEQDQIKIDPYVSITKSLEYIRGIIL
ncbi:sugar phosphate isomerase/epimerase family protein [Flavitalea flava]